MQLSPQDIAVLIDNLPKGIEQKSLSDEQLALIYDRKWFKIWVPQSFGGLGLKLTEGLSLLHELAYWDGGLGWTVTLCAGANLFVGFIDGDLAQDIFVSPTVCFGGSGQISGIAEREGTQYRLTGQWKYATGAPHLTHFTVNARIYEDGKPLLDQEGAPLVNSFFVARDHALVHYDWDTFGLEVTASHTFSLDGVLVDKRQCFSIDAAKSTRQELLYQYPFMPFAELTLLANFMGMYHRFLDLMEKLFVVRSNQGKWDMTESRASFRKIDEMKQEFTMRQQAIFELAERSWQCLEDKGADEAVYAAIATDSRDFVAKILANIIQLYPSAGISGASLNNEINRVFRNILTASQHRLLQKAL